MLESPLYSLLCLGGKQICLYTALILVLGAGSGRAASNATHEAIEMGLCPAANSIVQLKISGDGRHIAVIATGPDGVDLVQLDGQEVARGSAIRGLALSSDGRRVAYAKHEKDGWTVVADGTAQQKYEAIGASPDNVVSFPSLYMSPNGKHLAYYATRAGRWMVVVDGKEEESYRGVDMFTFSDDGEHWAYVAGETGRFYCVHDGKQGAQRYGILDLAFRPGTNSVAYVVLYPDSYTIVTDSQETRRLDSVSGGPVFSPDGRHLAYSAKTAVGMPLSLFVDGVAIKGLQGVPELIQQIILSADGTHLAYVQSDGRGTPYERVVHTPSGDTKSIVVPTYQAVVCDGVKGPRMDRIKRLVFSGDGKHLTYVGMQDKESYVVVDGRKGRGYETIGGAPIFSEDGGHVAYVALRDGKWRVVLDEAELDGFDLLLPQMKGQVAIGVGEAALFFEKNALWFFVRREEHVVRMRWDVGR
jgi:hypothetical protein